MRFWLGVLLCSMSLSGVGSTIEQRIQPVGKVHVQELQASGAATKSADLAVSGAQDAVGQKTYERYCIACHRDGLVGAPKFHDEHAWRTRLEGKTMDNLVASAIKGLNAMPAKGTCFECSDEELKSAIEYMLPKS